MICTSVRMMNRVARIGAAKMLKQGYSYGGATHCNIPNTFDIFLPDEKAKPAYRVDLKMGMCTCSFWTNNRPHFGVGETTCKHLEFIKIEEAIIAQGEADADARDDARELALTNERSSAWTDETEFRWEGYGDLRVTGGASHAEEENTITV